MTESEKDFTFDRDPELDAFIDQRLKQYGFANDETEILKQESIYPAARDNLNAIRSFLERNTGDDEHKARVLMEDLKDYIKAVSDKYKE